MEFHMINIMHAALPIRPQTERTTFSCKDDCILTKHTRQWTCSALRLHYDLCRTSFIRLRYISAWSYWFPSLFQFWFPVSQNLFWCLFWNYFFRTSWFCLGSWKLTFVYSLLAMTHMGIVGDCPGNGRWPPWGWWAILGIMGEQPWDGGWLCLGW